MDRATVGGVPVVGAKEEGEEVAYLLERPLAVERPMMCIDWEFRYDKMQQHSAQHLLSHLVTTNWGIETKSFHMNKGEITLDSACLTPERVADLEAAANELIRAHLEVTDRVDAAGHRVIEISGVGASPCGGTHVRSTSEVQVVVLEYVRPDRLTFLAGARALKALREHEFRATELTRILAAPPDGHIAAAQGLRDALRTKHNQLQGMGLALTRALATRPHGDGESTLEIPSADATTLRGVAILFLKAMISRPYLLHGSMRERAVPWVAVGFERLPPNLCAQVLRGLGASEHAHTAIISGPSAAVGSIRAVAALLAPRPTSDGP